MASSGSPPRSVEDIFDDYKGRRNSLVQALTLDVDVFFSMCHPEKENVSLYGLPDGSWRVSTPETGVLPQLPEPTLGINFARDGMKRTDWLVLIAAHCDCWLLSVAFYFGASLNRNERERLFSLINNLPTVLEDVRQAQIARDKPPLDSGSTSKSSKKRLIDGPLRLDPRKRDQDHGKDAGEHSENLCEICGGNYFADEFWICCDICDKWFHGNCVNMSPVKAENIMEFKCPTCSLKNPRLN